MKNKLIVIKIGGKIISNNNLFNFLIQKIQKINENIVLVHGGGNIASEYFKTNNLPVKMINGRRITDKLTLDKLVMLYAGSINKNLVSKLSKINKKYIGLSGIDGKVITSKKREIKDIDYGFVGDIEKIDGDLLSLLINNKIYPVISPITADKKGNLLNTNADTIATMISIEMSKYYDVNLFYCFDKEGVMNNNEVINKINHECYLKLLANNQIKDGMIPKLENSFKALKNGVKSVHIGDINIFNDLKNTTEICLS